MKNLNLENFGVQEMDAKEMVAIDGGLPWTKIYKIAEKVVVALGVADFLSDVADGWKAGKC